MPVAKTLSSEQVWQSDDGQITKYDVVMESEGRSFKSQTFSKKIAQVGFEGEVESYPDKKYPEKKLVRQPKRDFGGGYRSGGKSNNDEAMYRTSALKNAVEMLSPKGAPAGTVIEVADHFYNWLKNPTGEATTAGTVEHASAPSDEVVPEEIEDDPIDLSNIPF